MSETPWLILPPVTSFLQGSRVKEIVIPSLQMRKLRIRRGILLSFTLWYAYKHHQHFSILCQTSKELFSNSSENTWLPSHRIPLTPPPRPLCYDWHQLTALFRHCSVNSTRMNLLIRTSPWKAQLKAPGSKRILPKIILLGEGRARTSTQASLILELPPLRFRSRKSTWVRSSRLKLSSC